MQWIVLGRGGGSGVNGGGRERKSRERWDGRVDGGYGGRRRYRRGSGDDLGRIAEVVK